MSKTARTPYRRKKKTKQKRKDVRAARTVKSNASDAAGAMSSSFAHACTRCSSSTQVWLLTAEMTKYVSSAYLTSLGVGRRSAALTMYAAWPRPEPWTTLASMSAGSETSPRNFVQCIRLSKKSLIQFTADDDDDDDYHDNDDDESYDFSIILHRVVICYGTFSYSNF